jgi:dTDP-4-dehydrorhamnose reductase/dTDP-4-dehydrorhamnose 3,5-epimerase
MVEFGKSITIRETPIPGLLLLDLPVFGDSRGWFKENWQREKMLAAGLPDFGPVQNNISFNDEVGVTRGIHAEPWDKYVSIATGKIFGAWVDLREGKTFGAVFTAELDPSMAIFVPSGVANSYQTLEPNTAYVYLVNDHWSANAKYTFVNLNDATANIPWPIPLQNALVSDKDLAHPQLADVVPMAPKGVLIIGGNGQLGQSLRLEFPNARFVGRAELDITDPEQLAGIPWSDFATVINASAYTKVDEAETAKGRRSAWATNVDGVAALVEKCREHRLLLVHVSSDYVFDGTATSPYTEGEPLAPLGVYAQTKAAGDALVATLPRHYIVRTSWAIGDGANFVRTMIRLAENGVDPKVVNDQVGRLTFTQDLAAGIRHLVDVRPPFGSYNVTNDGPTASWAEIAAQVFELTGHDPARVTGVSTDEYFAATPHSAPRPLYSVLDLALVKSTGFTPADWPHRLRAYVAKARTNAQS